MQQPIGAGMQEEPDLVGFPAVAGGSIGLGVELVLLDHVFHSKVCRPTDRLDFGRGLEMSDQMTNRKNIFRILAIIGIVLTASVIDIRSSIARMSQAQIMAALYGVIIGHVDACGLTLQPWLVEAMGQKISRLASDDDDRELAIGLVQSMVAEAQKSPSMTCTEVRDSLKQLEMELR